MSLSVQRTEGAVLPAASLPDARRGTTPRTQQGHGGGSPGRGGGGGVAGRLSFLKC